jgi:CubicO group peptidase (beta-lactamase class C family)
MGIPSWSYAGATPLWTVRRRTRMLGLAVSELPIEQKDLPVASIQIVRSGVLLLDASCYPYLGEQPHDVASVTKSGTSTLVGIAIDRGLLALDHGVLRLLKELALPPAEHRKEKIEISNLLTASPGLACGYLPGEQELYAMIASENYVELALGLLMMTDPGPAFAHCSSGSHSLSGVVTRAAHESSHEFAIEHLFAPLGFPTLYGPWIHRAPIMPGATDSSILGRWPASVSSFSTWVSGKASSFSTWVSGKAGGFFRSSRGFGPSLQAGSRSTRRSMHLRRLPFRLGSPSDARVGRAAIRPPRRHGRRASILVERPRRHSYGRRRRIDSVKSLLIIELSTLALDSTNGRAIVFPWVKAKKRSKPSSIRHSTW